MKKRIALLLASILCVTLLAACGGKATSEPAPADSGSASASEQGTSGEGGSGDGLRVAAIFAGAVNDGNWNETQFNGLKRIEEQGAAISYMENVGDTDVAEAARTYGAEGYDLVYLSTNSFQDYCAPIAETFPDTTFVQINGTIITDNFISVKVADEQQGFLQGVAAALLSESGKVGFVGGQEITPIILGSEGFQQGVDYANENYGLSVEAIRRNTDSFTDVNRAKETAISFIESGCDVVTPMADDASVGVMEAAEEKGIKAIASGIGLTSSAPTATQVVVVKDISLTYDATYAAFLADTLKADEVVVYGVKEGVIFLTDWSDDVDAEAKANIEEVMDKLASGDITVATE